MKILLAHSFMTSACDDPVGVTVPLGLAYLAAYLEKAGVEVEVLDAAAEGIDCVRLMHEKLRYGLLANDIKERLRQIKPDIVGISCISTLHAQDAFELARIVKRVNPEILVVMGGAHPSSDPAGVAANKHVDVVVVGEGEETLLEIVRRFEAGQPLDNIPGTYGGPPRPLISNLDTLLFPARHLLPMPVYFKHLRENANYLMRNRPATLISSRGCPGECVYCAVRLIWGRAWRGRSPKNVVDEIEYLKREYGVNEVHFLDDSISVDMKRLEGICDEIIRRKLDVKWTTPNGIALWYLDKPLLKKMKQAGCYRVTFGLESGNYETLHQFIGKQYTYSQAKEIIKYANKIGLWTVGTFIIGLPYEKRESIEDTINFAISTDLDFAVFYIANPFPGTPMYDIYAREGFLPPGGAYEVVRGCRTKYFTHQELTAFQANAFSRFMRSRLKKPFRVLRKIRSLEDFRYTLKLGRQFIRLFLGQVLIKSKGMAALWGRREKKKLDISALTKNRKLNKIYFTIFPEKIMHHHTFRLGRFVKEMVAECDQANHKVLDVGAGTCFYQDWFKKASYTSQDIVNNQERTVDIVCDAASIPVEAGSFNSILCIQVLEHIKEPKTVFKEFDRVLQPGGKVFLTTHLAFEEHMVPHDYFRFTQYGLKFLAESTGFKVESIKPQGGRFIVLNKELQVLFPRLFRQTWLVPLFYLIFSIPLFLLSVVMFLLDFLDKDKSLTLGYECVFVKKFTL